MSLLEIQKYNETLVVTKKLIACLDYGINVFVDITTHGKVFIHITYDKEQTKLTSSTYKQMLKDFQQICEAFSARGFKYMFTWLPENDNFMKFNSMFGFEPIQLVTPDKDSNMPTSVIMRKEL